MDMVTTPRALQFVAFGEDGASKAGGSRAATFLLFREQLLAARSYARNPAVLAEWGNDAMIQRAAADALVRVIDRKSVVSGKSVSVRVDLCGRRIIKKKTKATNKH